MSGADGSNSRPSDEPIADVLEGLFRDGRLNAFLAWIPLTVLVLVFFESLLDADYAWLTFTAAVGAIVLLPPAVYQDWRVMLPWELVGIALLPVLIRGVLRGAVGTFATYLALAGLALLIVVELHQFTQLKVTHWFAVAIVVLATLAAVAVWTVARWSFDIVLGTAYLVDNEALMLEWTRVTLAGVAAGVLFDGYFRRRDRVLWRLLRRVIRR
ncbi:MAG: hypothetical protein ABEH64_09255 [Salinirussus sp.]